MRLVKIGKIEFTDQFGVNYSFAFEETELKELQGILNKYFEIGKQRSTLPHKTRKGKR
jgi:hypothetical protein